MSSTSSSFHTFYPTDQKELHVFPLPLRESTVPGTPAATAPTSSITHFLRGQKHSHSRYVCAGQDVRTATPSGAGLQPNGDMPTGTHIIQLALC